MKLLQALCPLVFLLACSMCNASVLQDACKAVAAKNPDTGYDYCIKFFQADKGSASADKRGLATIAVKITGAAAKSTASHIAALRASEKDKKRLAGLSDCSKVYTQAVAQTSVAAKGIASGTPRGRADAVTALSAVEDAPVTCEQGFQDLGVPSSLASEDDANPFLKEYWVEEYGNTSLQDKWCAPELDGLMPTRKERSITGNHKQDQDSREGDFLDPFCGGYLKIKEKEDAGVLGEETMLCEEMEVNIKLPGVPWGCAVNAA